MNSEVRQAHLLVEWRKKLQGPVAVLLGGSSAEREISLQSGAAIIEGLKSQGIEVVAIDTATPDWLTDVVQNYKHAFIALHGVGGEDGTVQSALEKVGITYTGSGVSASALAMDKIKTKLLWQSENLSTPDFTVLRDVSDCKALIEKWGEVIIKPASEGSSIGMAIATTESELEAAYLAAKTFDNEVLAEQVIRGAEFTVAILENRALPVIRLETDHTFYDYDAKYIADDTRYILPSGLSSEKEEEIKELALAAFKSVGCKAWGRVDVMQNELGEFFLLEVNTVPGMTSHSLVPMAAKADGKNFGQLVEDVLRLSVDV